ncbi:MAG: ModE family transcriptional regulator [Acidocella sp. 20-61-6]|nr:MAG: ModE family transcriptional regulator [Acidocella sp. 20-61-6]
MKQAWQGDLRLRLRLVQRTGIAMGPGRADLLAHIRESGSIAAAGRQMGMSYKRAWALVESMNNTFRAPLVAMAKGGAGGGGARLTEMGERVLTAYRRLEAAATREGQAYLAEINGALQVPPEQKDG